MTDVPKFFVNALSGVSTYQTMRVTSYHHKKALHILIDSGSAHNFLDCKKAQKLGCQFTTTDPLPVAVANGSQLMVTAQVKGFQWQTWMTTFQADVMVLPLGCCDVVLGVQ